MDPIQAEPWWRHQMETFSTDLRLNIPLNKQSRSWWFETISHPLCPRCNNGSFLVCWPIRQKFLAVKFCHNTRTLTTTNTTPHQSNPTHKYTLSICTVGICNILKIHLILMTASVTYYIWSNFNWPPYNMKHDDVIKWKHFPRYWPFVREIHRSPVNSPHKGQWRGALMFCLICVWINGWVNNWETGDLRCYRAHYDVIVMISIDLDNNLTI